MLVGKTIGEKLSELALEMGKDAATGVLKGKLCSENVLSPSRSRGLRRNM